MPSRDNVEIIERFFREVFDRGNFDYIDDIIDPQYTFNGSPTSAESTKQWARKKRTKYRNLRFQIAITNVQDDSLSVKWEMSGDLEAGGEPVVKKGLNQLIFRAGRCISNYQTDSDTDHGHTAMA